MNSFLLGISRFCLSAWVGAASLFVVAGVREVRSPQLDSFARDVMVAARFPAYYWFGFPLMLTSLVLLAVCLRSCQRHKRTLFGIAIGLKIALVLMVVDSIWIYQPLMEMITPPGQPRTEAFQRSHHYSMMINAVSLMICLICAVTLCCLSPAKTTDDPPTP